MARACGVGLRRCRRPVRARRPRSRVRSGLLADAGALARPRRASPPRALGRRRASKRSCRLFDAVGATAEARWRCRCPARTRTCAPITRMTGLTLGPHPLPLLRAQLRARRCRRSRSCGRCRTAARVAFAGLVHLAPAAADRQRRHLPDAGRRGRHWSTWWSGSTWPSASAACCWNRDCWRSKAGWNREDGVQHLIAERLKNLATLLGSLDARRGISGNSLGNLD